MRKLFYFSAIVAGIVALVCLSIRDWAIGGAGNMSPESLADFLETTEEWGATANDELSRDAKAIEQLGRRVIAVDRLGAVTEDAASEKVQALLERWREYCKARGLAGKLVEAKESLDEMKNDPSKATEAARLLEQIRNDFLAAEDGDGARDLEDWFRREVDRAKALERVAQHVERINEVLKEARRALEAGNCDGVDDLEARFNRAVAALGDATDLVEDQVDEANRIWRQMKFRKLAQPLIDKAVAAAAQGEGAQREINDAAAEIASFLEDVPQAPPGDDDCHLHWRLCKAKENLPGPGSNVDEQVLIVVYATSEFFDLQGEIHPELKTLFKDYGGRIVDRRVVLITEDGTWKLWDPVGGAASEDESTAFDIDNGIRLAGALRKGIDAVEDLVIRDKSVPFRSFLVWTGQYPPTNYPEPPQLSSLASIHKGKVFLYWFGCEFENCPILSKMFGDNGYQVFRTGEAAEMKDGLGFLLGELAGGDPQ